MTKFTIQEVQNEGSTRQGYEVELKDLSSAKRHATKNQFFMGTVMKVICNGELVATKKGSKWI